jgi:Flp pilus assembly protein TadD
MEIEPKLIQMLMEAGYLAGGYGFFEESQRIFEGIRAARPDSELPLIGLALSKINEGKHEEASRILWDQALKLNPESDLAKSFLGLSLKLGGLTSESRTLLQEVVDADRDDAAVNMARNLLEEMGP